VHWLLNRQEVCLFLYLYFVCLYFVTFLSQVYQLNSGYSPRGEHGSDNVAPTQNIGGIGPFWWWRKPECPEETTGTSSAPKTAFLYGATYLVPRTGIEPTRPHRHWLQACESDTSDAPWTTRPPRTPYYLNLWNKTLLLKKQQKNKKQNKQKQTNKQTNKHWNDRPRWADLARDDMNAIQSK
jgi:hypothetical protein